MNTRYEILNQLGEGGEGSVWKAWDTRLQRFVAIKKLLPPSLREVPDAGDIFAEASALSALQHPNIVSVYDVENDDDSGPYVVMEFLNGENLEQTVQRGGLTPGDFVSIANQSLEGLVAAHKLGMQHRDIKPSNIMLTWLPDQRFIAKLLDFGLAKFTTRPKQQTVKGNNKILGSIYFMAPEQFSHRPLDSRSDLYSLGCVLYYGLTTRYPFAGETPAQVMQSHLDHMVAPLRDVRPDLQPILCDWVMWLIRRQPEQRPRDASQAMEVFRGLVSGEITELPQSATGLRTTTVMQTRQIPIPLLDAAGGLANTSGGRAKSKRTAIYLGTAGVAVAALAAFMFKGNNSPARLAEASTPVVVAPQDTKPSITPSKLPPAPVIPSGLTVWLDASAGVVTVDGDVQTWQDLDTTTGGATDFLAPQEPVQPLSQAPRVTEVKDTAGLVGTHRVLTFEGHHSLLAKQRDGKPTLAEGSLDDLSASLFVVFRAGAPDKLFHRIICAMCGNEDKAWDLMLNSTRLQGGVRALDGKPNKAEIDFPFNDEFVIGCFGRDAVKDAGKVYIVNKAGKEISTRTPISVNIQHGPLKKLRLGAVAQFTDIKEADYFVGDIATVLLYNRVLPHEERVAVMAQLRRRFFGK
jgi:serine/threonine protein kinase